MASLNHVSMWSDHGWVRVTAEEAARLHPGGTVSAHSGLFMCELCGQYVTLTDGEQRVRYFKHSAEEKSKTCPERTFGANVVIDYKEVHELPLRIGNITEKRFELSLGILPAPPEILAAARNRQIRISAQGKSNQFVYSFERLIPGAVTYLSLGYDPSQSYEIEADETLKQFWPKTVTGIEPGGSVFDGSTGKMLVRDADVLVHKKYYYVSQSRLYREYEHIKYQLVCKNREEWKFWYVYEVEATAFEEDAAMFFLDVHCRLSSVPVTLQAVWPLYEETPYVLRHSHDIMFMHMDGQGELRAKTFPFASLRNFPCKDHGKVLKIRCNGRQQMISAGRANMLQYTYLWKEKLEETTPCPEVSVTDRSGKEIAGGTVSKLPDQGLISVVAPFDGKIEIYKQSVLQERIPLKAEVRQDADHLNYSNEVCVFQGLDLVWRIKFEKKSAEQTMDEEELLRRLQKFSDPEIPVDHSLGAMAQYLVQYPKVKVWLREKLQRGKISRRALQELKKIVVSVKYANAGDDK